MRASSKGKVALVGIIAVALVLRLALLPLPGYRADIEFFEAWSRVLATSGPGAIYGPDVVPRVDYTPGYLYVLWIIGIARRAIDPNGTHALAFRALLKLTNIVADFAAAAIGYALVRRFSTEPRAVAVAAALLVGPVFWLDSTLWGQADTIPAALLFGAALLMLQGRRTLPWILLALAVLVKPQGIVLVPVFAVYHILRGGTALSLARASVAALFLAYVTTLPFTSERSPVGVLRFLAGRYVFGLTKVAHGSEGAFTFYTIVGNFFRSDALPVAGVPLHSWSLALVAAAIALVAFGLARALRASDDRPENDLAFVYAAALSLLALFFFGTRMHERYLLSALAFGTLLIGDGFATTVAVGALTLSFAVNCALIFAGGLSGNGHHHAVLLIVGHVFSVVNLIALATLARTLTRRTRTAVPTTVATDRPKWWRQGDSKT